ETVVPGPGPTPAATSEEMELILRWLETPGTRLVELDGVWCAPAHGAGAHRAWFEALHAAGESARPFEDHRRLRPVHRPAR
ncbi:MAG: hypothetical protein ABR520_02405, partial [Mycobacteriales bacterium]